MKKKSITIKEKLKKLILSYIDDPNKYRYNDLDGVVCGLRGIIRDCPVVYYCGSIYVFDGRYYRYIGLEEFKDCIGNICESIGVKASRWDAIAVKVLAAVRDNVVLKSDKELLCFQNGVVDFSDRRKKTYEISEYSPDNMIFYDLPYSYEPDCPTPLFDKFLERMMPELEERMCLQELCGCIFLDRRKYKIEKMGIMLGTGANGKSTFVEVLTRVIGKENVTNVDLWDLVMASVNEREMKMRMISGKPLNISYEMPDKLAKNERLKSLISSEPQIARGLYRDPVIFDEIPLLFVNLNSLGMIGTATTALGRRMMIFPCDQTIPPEERDITLADKICGESSGILNWILEGRRRFEANGYVFTESRKMFELKKNYMSGMTYGGDSFEMFVKKTNYNPHPVLLGQEPCRAKVGTILDQYRRWCNYLGLPAPTINVEGIGRKMSAMGYRTGRCAEGKYYLIYSDPDNEIKEW